MNAVTANASLSFICIHITLVCTRTVIQFILDELKSWNAYSIKRFVVRAIRIPHRNSGDPEILQRFDPLLEYGSDCLVLLEMNTKNLTSPVVHIKVSRNSLLFWLKLHGSARLA